MYIYINRLKRHKCKVGPQKREITGNVYSKLLASGYIVNKKIGAGAKRYNDIKLSPIYVDYGPSYKPASMMAT